MMETNKESKEIIITCDSCGEELIIEFTNNEHQDWDELQDVLTNNGFISQKYDNELYHYCELCKNML